MRIITPTTLDTKLNKKNPPHLIDVSEEDEFDEENFGNPINVPASKFGEQVPQEFENIDEFDEIVLIDGNGEKSKEVAAKLKEFGYTKVTVLEGGIQNWYAQGYE
jgi:rhodanese-related sulfurtransferase